MSEHNRYDDRGFIRIIRDYWPIIFSAILACLGMGAYRQSAVAQSMTIETLLANDKNHETRLTRLEQAFTDLTDLMKEHRKHYHDL